jgi:hypothetical protein
MYSHHVLLRSPSSRNTLRLLRYLVLGYILTSSQVLAQDRGPTASSGRPAPQGSGPRPCIHGYVWREAIGPIDDVCVTPQTRQQTWDDNAQTDARRLPGGCDVQTRFRLARIQPGRSRLRYSSSTRSSALRQFASAGAMGAS